MSFSVERIIDKAYLINKRNKGETRNKCKNKKQNSTKFVILTEYDIILALDYVYFTFQLRIVLSTI